MNIVEQELNFLVIPLCSKCCKDETNDTKRMQKIGSQSFPHPKQAEIFWDEEHLASVSPPGNFHS